MFFKNIGVLVVLVFLFQTTGCDEEKGLSRVRRYLAFPEGAVFSAVFCLTDLMGITKGADIFSLNINWGIIYELPNETKPLLDIYKPAMKRRNRRDLYGRVETVLDSMGYNGRTCILRSICEAEQKFMDDSDLISRTLGLIFKFPMDPILNHEPDIHHTYHYASSIGHADDDRCYETFQCPFSLIDLALGYYSYDKLQ